MSKRSEYLNKRDLHREYIKSPLWQAFRKKALAHYGAICNRCNNHGTDVDHLTYERWGEELISDVQVLCRCCHEAKHAIERTKRRKSNKRSLHIKGLWAYMTAPQKKALMTKFDFTTEASLRMCLLASRNKTALVKEACRIMNVDVFGLRPRSIIGWKTPKKKIFM